MAASGKKPTPGVCPVCDGPIEQKKKGPDRQTCSDRCRQALSRARRRATGKDAPSEAARAEVRRLREIERRMHKLLTSPVAVEIGGRPGKTADLLREISKLFPLER